MQSDRELIWEVLVNYCYLVDNGRAAEVADAVFTQDAVDDHGFGVVQGRDALRAMFAAASETLDHSVHSLSNHVLRIEGDIAYSRCYATCWHWSRTNAPQGRMREADFVSTGAYVDVLRKIDGRWWISHRKCHLMGAQGLAIGRSTPELADMMDNLAKAGPPADIMAAGWRP